eukprot:SAG11_NODE_11663_length_745_cov_2.458204_2_plen_65_part_01
MSDRIRVELSTTVYVIEIQSFPKFKSTRLVSSLPGPVLPESHHVKVGTDTNQYFSSYLLFGYLDI